MVRLLAACSLMCQWPLILSADFEPKNPPTGDAMLAANENAADDAVMPLRTPMIYPFASVSRQVKRMTSGYVPCS